MKRLDFRLPEFTRHAWVGDTARAEWEPRIARVVTAWRATEWLSVIAGLREAALLVLGDEELPTVAKRVAAAGFAVAPVDRIPASDAYVSARTEPAPNTPTMARVVITRPEHVDAFRSAWECGDQLTVGRLLGYPACCSRFFKETWVDQRFVDTTWPSAARTAEVDSDVTEIDLGGPPEANVLLRWLGVRSVPHLPCRFDCAPSLALAHELLRVGRESGYGDEMDDLISILGWPIQWTALHGIAEIKTPVVRISATTDATAVKYTVRWRGQTFPRHGARGLVFPYSRPQGLRITGSRSFDRGLRNASRPLDRLRDGRSYHADNGFPSRAAMDAAHRPLVDLVASRVGAGSRVIDLGCGNGALLEKICTSRRGVVPFGVDLDEKKIAHARLLHPGHDEHFRVGDLFDAVALGDAEYDVAILMPGRLLEAPDRAPTLLRWLGVRVGEIVVYRYPGYETADDAASMAAAAGLRVDRVRNSCAVARAVVGQVVRRRAATSLPGRPARRH